MCFAGRSKLKGILFCFEIGFAGKILHVGKRKFKYNFKQEFKSRSVKSKEALQQDILWKHDSHLYIVKKCQGQESSL